MSICLDRRVDDRPARGALDRAEVAADRVEGSDVGDFVGGELEVVQVRLQAVAAVDGGDRLVAGVHDHVFALAEAEREHTALPPRQGALPFVCLLASGPPPSRHPAASRTRRAGPSGV